MTSKERRHDGLHEGIARCISQAAVYGIEARKTIEQLGTSIPGRLIAPRIHWMHGMATSSLTAGLVFTTYFSVYNRMDEHILAGITAALVTATVKIPIANGMRMLHTGRAYNLFHATRKLYRQKSLAGLYGGGKLSILEDAIEFDLRTRMYKHLRQLDQNPSTNSLGKGTFWGTVAGTLAASFVTPIDTVRTHIAFQKGTKVDALQVAQNIWRQGGLPAFYRGTHLRLMSSVLKSTVFFAFFEMLQMIADKKTESSGSNKMAIAELNLK